MFGILNIHKPTGWTSRDVVNRVQGLVRPAKAGHAGTLDPLATGVLVVCIGPATKLISYVQEQPKEYLATFLLGRTSPSEDVETKITELKNAPVPALTVIEAKLHEFKGEISQRPPAYSALKLKGRRAYELARTGENVQLAARPIRIYQLNIEKYKYPELQLNIHCGSGTYVRSLGRDLAESLGTGAVMSALTRTAIGPYNLANAIRLEDLKTKSLDEQLIPPISALTGLPQIVLSPEEIREIQHGRMIEARGEFDPSLEVFAAIDQRGELQALLKPRDSGKLGPKCNFLPPV